MAKDVLGNELEVGDLVQVTLDRPVMFGRVKSIADGGISLVGGTKHGDKQQAMTLGTVLIDVEASSQFDPRDGRAPGLLAVHDPDKGKRTGILQ